MTPLEQNPPEGDAAKLARRWTDAQYWLFAQKPARLFTIEDAVSTPDPGDLAHQMRHDLELARTIRYLAILAWDQLAHDCRESNRAADVPDNAHGAF